MVLTALATFPDLDLLLPGTGTGLGSPWAHRGASHSLTAALAAALLAVWILDVRRGRARTFAVAFLTAASHGLLDTMTRGGEGVMLLWPLRDTRYVALLRPLPASAFGVVPFEWPRAIALLVEEALFFAPVVVYAIWPRRAARIRPAERPS